MRERISITTPDAYHKVQALDKTFLNTESYLGVEWFWNYEYRHYLRSASYAQRRKIHAAFVKAGLAIAGESNAHLQIIKTYTK